MNVENSSQTIVEQNQFEDANFAEQKIIITSVGTTLTEIFCVISCIVQSCLFLSTLTLISIIKSQNRSTFYRKIYSWLSIIILLLIFTLFSNYLTYFLIFLVLANLCLLYTLFPNISGLFQLMGRYEVVKCTYVTNYKAAIQLSTAICILAVDFRVFPFRFHKAEVYGIGVMDTAVGAIIFSNGLTSSIARYNQLNFKGEMKAVFWLAFIGMVRVLALTKIGYHVNTSEYGLHWNFFFTIAVVKLTAAFLLLLFKSCLKQPLFLLLSLATIISYQTCLSRFLTDIIDVGFHGDYSRDTFLDANREGIISCFGYIAIYFIGIFFGIQVFRKNGKTVHLVKWLFTWFCMSLVSMNVSIHFVAPISRQMSNLSYFLFQIFFNTWILLLFLINDIILETSIDCVKKKISERYFAWITVSSTFQAISSNQLVYFLMANVLTGLVNLSVDTNNTSTSSAMVILIGYLFILDQCILLIARTRFKR